jgi:hypothetical protein
MCLTDGVTSGMYSDVGGKNVQHAIAEILRKKDNLLSISEEELRFYIACAMKETLFLLSHEMNLPQEQFASTFMAILMKENAEEEGDGDGPYCRIIHLGDGMIGETDGDQVNILSYPQNGITKKHTYTTASKYVYNQIRIKDHFAKNSSIFMMTDGVTEKILKNNVLKQNYRKVLLNKDWSGFEKMLRDDRPKDDYSFAVVSSPF